MAKFVFSQSTAAQNLPSRLAVLPAELQMEKKGPTSSAGRLLDHRTRQNSRAASCWQRRLDQLSFAKSEMICLCKSLHASSEFTPSLTAAISSHLGVEETEHYPPETPCTRLRYQRGPLATQTGFFFAILPEHRKDFSMRWCWLCTRRQGEFSRVWCCASVFVALADPARGLCRGMRSKGAWQGELAELLIPWPASSVFPERLYDARCQGK